MQKNSIGNIGVKKISTQPSSLKKLFISKVLCMVYYVWRNAEKRKYFKNLKKHIEKQKLINLVNATTHTLIFLNFKTKLRQATMVVQMLQNATPRNQFNLKIYSVRAHMQPQMN